MDGLSLNITQTQVEKLKALFPEAVSQMGVMGILGLARNDSHCEK